MSLLATLVVGAMLAFGSGTADAAPDDNWVRPPNHPGAPGVFDRNYSDPSIIVDGSTYYAYATNTGGSHLPVLSSTDLSTWSPQLSYNRTTAANRNRDRSQFVAGRPVHLAQRADNSFDRWINDGLLDYHDGARQNISGHNHLRSAYWAPGVSQINGKYVAYSSVPQLSDDHHCIRVSVADGPAGPFVPQGGSGWLQCDSNSSGPAYSPNGSNDPDPFVGPGGTPYLVWKSEGNPNPPYSPTILWARQLNSNGTGFAPGSTKRELLRTEPGNTWEGTVIENPSMVFHNGRFLLFYSGNEWVGSNYATGYAICDTPLGPCQKPITSPLMSTTSNYVSPGGADAFVDTAGNLQLAFHHWVGGTAYEPTQTAYRKMQIAAVNTQNNGVLRVDGFAAPTPSGVQVRVGYTAEQAGLIREAAGLFGGGVSRPELQRVSTLLLSYVKGFSSPPTNPPAKPNATGAASITTLFTPAEAALVDDLGAFWGGGFNRRETVKLATIVIAYVILTSQ